MKKKQKLRVVLCCFCFFILYPCKVKAEYFTNHTDWTSYCMQAKDVQLSDHDRRQWIADGILPDKLVEKSEIAVNQFHASDNTQYWSKYEGAYDVNVSQVESCQLSEGETSADISATIYLDAKEKNWNYIVLRVNVTADVTEHEDKKVDEVKNETLTAIKLGVKKEVGKRKMFLFWGPFGAIISACYGISLYSDIKVLICYRKKKKKWEGKQ